MKIKLPEIQKKKKTEEPDEGMITFGLYESAPDSFEVSVRNDEPILKCPDEDAETGWKNYLVLNISGACILVTVLSIFLTAAYAGSLIPFTAAGMILYLGITMAEAVKPGKLRWIIAVAAAVILIATVAVWHAKIGGGLAILSGYFYDMAEQAQAYLYDRFTVSEEAMMSSVLCTRLAVIWLSCLAGLILALPPARYRRGVSVFLAGFVMIAFAYYGLIPSWICIGILILAGIIAVSKGSLLSSVPLLLIAVLLFGAVMLISPGESLTISRADETFRDKFALRSSFIESPEDQMNDLTELQKEDLLEEEQEQQEEENNSASLKMIRTIAVLFFILAAVTAAAVLLWRKLKKRIDMNRAGIDAVDNREAIKAMFPYCVRWLQSYGIEAAGKPFSALTPEVREEMSREYAYRYEDMYDLWQEASYSDHEMSDDQRKEMSGFMHETIDIIREGSDFKDRILTKIRYAL